MKIQREFHCARLHRRISLPLNISFRGRVFSLLNWSEGGMFVEVPPNMLSKNMIETAEVLIPCVDGVFSVPVQFKPLRQIKEGWGCQFIDLPPRETGILRFYSDVALRGDATSMGELDDAGRLAATPTPLPPSPSAAQAARTKENAKESGNKLLQIPAKHLLLLGFLILILAGIAITVVPYLAGNVMKKLNRAAQYEQVALSRIQAAELGIKDLENKIAAIKQLLSPAGFGSNSLRPEQIRALEIGLSQLETERDMAEVHLGVLKNNLALIQRGDFLIEETIFSGYNTDARLSTAPYLNDVLSDLAAGARLEPQNEADRAKYLAVAEARLAHAEYARESTRVHREALTRILERAERAGAASALPQNTLEFMRRDLALLEIEEKRLDHILELYRHNVEAVQAGNFTYETQLFHKFDPRPAQHAGPAHENVISR